MESKEYIVWCDESAKTGKYYSNFYGGVLIQSKNLAYVLSKLKKVVEELHINDEIKWQKVDEFKLPAFKKLMDVFFALVMENKIKVRIMFTHNAKKARGLNETHRKLEYFLLYYQFFKHSFGFQHSNTSKQIKNVIAYFDNLPDTFSKRQQFKEYIKGLESTKAFINANIKIKKSNITEVDSKTHLPIQFIDVILGAMNFRLNNFHKEKIVGTKKRAKRTRAKEKLYKHILSKIKEIRPNFNIGISTGITNIEDKWNHPYRHWCFTAKEYEIDETGYK